MNEIRVSTLTPMPRLAGALYDLDTGIRLLPYGTTLTTRAIELMRKYGVETVALIPPGEDEENSLRSSQYRQVDVDEIDSETPLASDVYSSDGKLLLTRGTRVSESMIARLRYRGYRGLYIKRGLEPDMLRRVESLRDALQEERSRETPPKVVFPAGELVADPRLLTSTAITHTIEAMESEGTLAVAPPDPVNALMRFVHFVDAFHERPNKTKAHYIHLYRQLVDQTARIFHLLATERTVAGDLVIHMIEQVIQALVVDRELLMGALATPLSTDDYLARHAVNVTVLAVNIAAGYGYSTKQVTEVAYGALLSDIGMLSVPETIRLKSGPLTHTEMLEIRRHTIYGIDRLQVFKQIPRIAPLVAYQSHERLDGSGYPHGRKAHGIHDFAKVVAIADVYHAMVGRRPFRDTRHLPYKAVEEILQMTSSRKLDNRFARSFLQMVSLFPVGSWVRLNTGECAQVVQANEGEFTRPVVTILFTAGGAPVAPQRIDLSKDRDRAIVAPAQFDDADPLTGF